MQQYNTHYFKYYALDSNMANPTVVNCIEDGGTVSYNSLDSLKTNARLKVSLDTSEIFDIKRIRICSVLNGNELPCGTFLVATPSSQFKSAVQSIDVTCYSTLWPVKVDKCDTRYYVPLGTNAVNEVKRILGRFGYQVIIPDSAKTTSVNQEWEIGTSYLEIVNSLLDSIGYTSLYVDVYGNYVAKPYILPSLREAEIIYDSDDINNIIEPSAESELDLFNVPNKFIRYVNSPEVDLAAVYINSRGITGTEATGIVNVDSQEVNDASDYDTLYELCKKAAEEATSIYHKVTIYTAINPIHLFLNCIQLNHYQLRGKFIETSWDIELKTGGTMTHNLREVIAC
ncbi:hypothetical protein [Cellulosilyticum lentocellum]|uniref:Uncharacterized protein n=1 Tax=Cellulosilyticum lentocellum (strain ATCC 49066 / DSM 5427 / NCIMB 11756 / RHM5) TaxID=642492 RepID=F2JPD9_CELLD|nr:hypothetical protein [Cellulosilyticum lentocellum]ADZ82487.1 hypothetical protein Clole_0754 [Cellulosilyticum lentocellum DSM 5427]